MPGFQIDFLGAPTNKDEFRNEINLDSNPYTDIFTKAVQIVKGEIIFRDEQQSALVESDWIFYVLDLLMKNTFWLNFRRPLDNRLSFTIPDGAYGDRKRPVRYIHLTLRTGELELLISYRSVESIDNFDPSQDIKFTVPVTEFNRAVWDVYDKMLVFLEELLEGIDGFEERFCLIPFRGESNLSTGTDYF